MSSRRFPDRETAAVTLTPNVNVVGEVSGVYTMPELSDEVGVMQATPEFVRANCGPVANRFLDAIPAEFFEMANRLGMNVQCEIRIHKMHKGDYPAYPGWHCDDPGRADYHGQPDYDRNIPGLHIFGSVSTDADGVCNPWFAGRPITIEVPTELREGETMWAIADAQIRAEGIDAFPTRDGLLYQFDNNSLHEVVQAHRRGWRLLFRISMVNFATPAAGGMISRQENIYRVAVGAW